MNFDDIVYLLCLLSCIGAGYVVRRIPLESQRELICTAFGVLIVLTVSSFHILHFVATLLLATASLKLFPPNKCHLVAFFLIFGYLVFFRIGHLLGLPKPSGPTNMIQMILTLKVIGLAFEKTNAWKRLKQRELQIAEIQDGVWVDAKSGGPLVEVSDYDVELQSVGFWEVLQYCFNYIGVLTGPYYRYRTYRDYFEMPFKIYALHVAYTFEKLRNACIYCFLYLITDYLWPVNYMLSDEFYEQRSFLYRLMYIWPVFISFRMRIYTGLTLSDCVCIMAGFGAYPDQADVNNGEGPRLANYAHLKRDADKHSYNFLTIINVRVKEVETSVTFREAMRHWNICVQYWLAINIYKQLPSKTFRTAATLLVSAFWHGLHPGHYLGLMGAAFYVPVEDMWHKLVRLEAQGMRRRFIDVCFWLATSFALAYLCVAFMLVEFRSIWRFYSSIYHVGYLAWGLMLTVGLLVNIFKRTSVCVKELNSKTE